MENYGQKISTALAKAQKGFGSALKGSVNPFHKSKYADLAACVDAVLSSLNENGISLIQKTHEFEQKGPFETERVTKTGQIIKVQEFHGGVAVETILVHESGESISGGILRVPAPQDDPQGYGSALTYARRYSLMALCGIAPEDDDGNLARKNVSKEVTKPQAQVQPQSQKGVINYEQIKEPAIHTIEMIKQATPVKLVEDLSSIPEVSTDEKISNETLKSIILALNTSGMGYNSDRMRQHLNNFFSAGSLQELTEKQALSFLDSLNKIKGGE